MTTVTKRFTPEELDHVALCGVFSRHETGFMLKQAAADARVLQQLDALVPLLPSGAYSFGPDGTTIGTLAQRLRTILDEAKLSFQELTDDVQHREQFLIDRIHECEGQR